ncbi:DUF2637 domain-containing protein [Streptomyces graminilatus]|uniref:DUF2637 domain-containing protein n=1 Tax=Streptomyces graminilatus TaxID=1464070 RepID=UPI0006E20E40|nr:DUF2637 domain-containing protein [Streptomyces graminilatus]
MDLAPWALPGGLAVAGIGAVAATGMVLSHRRRSSEQTATAEERAQLALHRRQSWQRRLAVTSLAVGCLMMFVLAGIAAWLSFGAQREYAHAHNGGDWDAATLFAMLLDAGALSLSLIRFFEALTLRSSGLTRLLLFAFVAASAQMNLLHAPEAGFSGAFLAVVPPLVYAVQLEMLLFKIEQVIMGRQKRRKGDKERGYSLLLWLPWPIGAPLKMWQAWRKELLATIDNVRVTGSQRPLTQDPDTDPAGLVPTSPAAAPAVAAPPFAPTAPDSTSIGQQTDGTDPETTETTETTTVTANATSVPSPAPSEPAGDPARPHVKQPAPHEPPESGSSTDPAATPVLAASITGSAAGAEAEDDEQASAEHGKAAEPEEGEETATHPDLENGRAEAVSDPDADDPEDEEGKDEGVEDDELSGPATGDDGRERQQVEIDLSALPKDEKPRQLAERIYLAHQVAGLPLNRTDLAQWAGYKNERSGYNEYGRLVKAYGPIIAREGAVYLDLDWSVQPSDAAQAQAAA